MTAPQISHAVSRDDSLNLGYFGPRVEPTHALTPDPNMCDPALTECPSVVSVEPKNFQGYEQPAMLTFRFSGQAHRVTVRGGGAILCSGAYGTLIGYDADHKPVAESDLELIDPADCSPYWNPDNITYGATATIESKSVIAYATVSPMSPLEFTVFGICCGHAGQVYSVQFGTSIGDGVRIVQARGPNPNRSFTMAPAERTISLQAAVTPNEPSPQITWEIADAADDRVNTMPPSEAPTAASASFVLPTHSRTRWPTDHPGAIDKKSLRYKVTAVWSKAGEVLRSDPVTVAQDEIDTIREEYFEFRLDTLNRHVPTREEFGLSRRVSVGENNGDYSYALVERRFKLNLNVLYVFWPDAWQLNTIYRNPNHNLNGHIPSSNKSKPSPVSWHMWGCAADLQTFPTDKSAKQYVFWQALNGLAVELGFDTEDLKHSLVGHVHVELDCP